MTDEKIAELKKRFDVEGLSFAQNDSGPVMMIDHPACAAAVSLHGAHVLSWIPAGGKEVIFTSRSAVFKEGTPVRGGIPICWPWFNAHPDDTDAYAHGFARRVIWNLASAIREEDAIVLQLTLTGDAKCFPHWPFAVHARLSIRAGAALEVSLETRNPGPVPFVVSQALHSYFAVGDIEKATLLGLDGCRYQDDVAGGVHDNRSGPLTFNGEVDRVYLDTSSPCTIVDPVLRRRIRVEKSGSRTTVVWNPGAALAAQMKDMEDNGYRRFVCVETTNALADQRVIRPGDSHIMTARISVESSD